MKKPIYFDNAASTWPKPSAVIQAMTNFMTKISANPGRSGHYLSLKASRIIFNAREAIALFFNVPNSEQVIFTSNATMALNMALKGILKKGDHVITSLLEHNSVLRPLRNLEKNIGIEVSSIDFHHNKQPQLDVLRSKIKSNTKLVVISHGSNIIGAIAPLKEIGKICRQNKLILLVDAAQTAGSLPIDLQKDHIDLLAFTGHKSLFGPQGIGGLCINNHIEISSFMQGGTGSRSEQEIHPNFLPDKLEAGTPNTVGISGLLAGINFIRHIGLKNIIKHKQALTNKLIKGLLAIQEISIYGNPTINNQTGCLSFNIKNLLPSQVGMILEKKYNILCRTGLHCAPQAHKTIKTFPTGTIRFSLSYFNTEEEIKYAINAIKEIIYDA